MSVQGSLSSGAFNRALDQSPWAREKLSPHAGRAFSVAVGPLHACFRVGPDGHVEAVSADSAAPDLMLRLSPLTLPTFLADPARWNEFVVEEGDVSLGGALKEVAQALPWLVEAAIAKTFGDVAGLRIAGAGRRLLQVPGYAAERFAGSVTSFARDEAHLVAGGDELRRLVQQAALLDSRTDALAARVDALGVRLAGVPGDDARVVPTASDDAVVPPA